MAIEYVGEVIGAQVAEKLAKGVVTFFILIRVVLYTLGDLGYGHVLTLLYYVTLTTCLRRLINHSCDPICAANCHDKQGETNGH